MFKEPKFIKFINKLHWCKWLLQRRKVKPRKRRLTWDPQSGPKRMRDPNGTCQDQLPWPRQARKTPAHTSSTLPTTPGWLVHGGAPLRGTAGGPAWASVLGNFKMTSTQPSSPHLDRLSRDTWHLYQHILHWSLITGLLPLFSRPGVSDSLWPHGLQPSRLPCPSLSPGVCSNSGQWCYPTTSSCADPSPYALTLSQPQGLKESGQQFNEVQTSPWGHPHPVPEIFQAGHRSHQLIGYSLWVQSSGQRRCSELRRWGQYLCTYYLLTLGKYRCSWSLGVLTWKREIIGQFCQVIVRITWDDTHKIWGIVTKPYMLAATPRVGVTWYHLCVWISL